MITALTITTQQIRFLRERLEAAPVQLGDLIRECMTALEYETHRWTRDDRCINARGICAAVINSEKWPPITLLREDHERRVFAVTDALTISVAHRPGGTVLGNTVVQFQRGGSVGLDYWPELVDVADDDTIQLTKLGRALLVQACIVAQEKTS